MQCVGFHPNSLYLATGSSDWTARLWDVHRGTCVRVFIGHQGIVSCLALSPDGRYLATAGASYTTSVPNTLVAHVYLSQERISVSTSGISALVRGSRK
jgi:WD40 repeat protein